MGREFPRHRTQWSRLRGLIRRGVSIRIVPEGTWHEHSHAVPEGSHARHGALDQGPWLLRMFASELVANAKHRALESLQIRRYIQWIQAAQRIALVTARCQLELETQLKALARPMVLKQRPRQRQPAERRPAEDGAFGRAPPR